MKHNFKVGQSVLWKSTDFDTKTTYIKATIKEAHIDHCLAVSEGNKDTALNDLKLWIDSDAEMNFFNFDILENL